VSDSRERDPAAGRGRGDSKTQRDTAHGGRKRKYVMHAAWVWFLAHVWTWAFWGKFSFTMGVVSSVWWMICGNVWPGVERDKLPKWTRPIQVLIKIGMDLPGAVMAGAGSRTPPGTPKPPTLGAAVTTALSTLMTFALLVLALVLVGCHPVQQAVLGVTPGVPAVTGCVAREQSCQDVALPDGGTAQVPAVCSESGRAWAAFREPCPYGCVLDRPQLGPGGVARCAPNYALPVVTVTVDGGGTE
jgi:hypothetical protein